MKQRFISVIIGAVMILSLVFGNASQANAISRLVVAAVDADVATETAPLEAPSEPELLEPVSAGEPTEIPTVAEEPVTPVEPATAKAASETSATPETTDLLKQLETEILPQIASVLTPEQQADFAAKISAGTSFRKAFKAVTLTPAQKTKLSTVFKAIPKKDIFATLTPAQKKQLFLKNKQLFIPTAEQISAKVSAGKQLAGGKSSFAPSTDTIVEKINAKLKFTGDEE